MLLALAPLGRSLRSGAFVSLIFILTLAVQAGLIVHVIKTGRNTLWIWAIALLPAAGSLAYVVVEILPQAFGGRTARRSRAGMQRMIDPNRDLRRAAAEVEISGNVDARRRLAEELYERGQYAEAATVYQGGLKGIFEHDPTLLLGLARAQFATADFAGARASLERLIQHNPDFKSADGHLLYARTLEAQNALDEAEHEYAAVAQGYPGAEARRFSRISWMARAWGRRIIARRRRNGWNGRAASSAETSRGILSCHRILRGVSAH